MYNCNIKIVIYLRSVRLIMSSCNINVTYLCSTRFCFNIAHSHAMPVAGALHAGGAHRGGGVRGVDVGAAVGRRVHEHDAALPRRRHRPQRGARAREARAVKNQLSSSSSSSSF